MFYQALLIVNDALASFIKYVNLVHLAYAISFLLFE